MSTLPGKRLAPTPPERLIVEGRLDGTLDGRPVTITADEKGICLTVDSVGSAWRLRRQLPSFGGVFAELQRGQVPVRLRIGTLGELPVLPRPNWIPRWVVRLAGLP